MFIYARAAALSFLILTLTALASAQQDAAFSDSTALSPQAASRYLDEISKSSQALSQKLHSNTIKTIERLKRYEARINFKLARKDSLKAAHVFGNAALEYQKLEDKLRSPSGLMNYIPALDTLGSSLKFLQGSPDFATNVNLQEKLKSTLPHVNGLNEQLRQAECLEQFLRHRKEYLKKVVDESGFAKELKKINKQAYYYQAQVREYENLLKDHKKAAKKALRLLAKSRSFQEFMRKHSVLASLFRLPGNDNDPASPQFSVAGLQTRPQVNSLIQQRISSGGPNGQQQFQQNIQVAQAQVNALKNKVSRVGSTRSDDIMPEGFRPNPEKTKNFLQRLELGTNIQSQKANSLFPITSDIGLSLGYKVNDKSVIGIGSSYKLGWGRSFQHIKVTHQGVGLRTFVDWKIKGSFWVSGGYEMNYRSAFRDIAELRDYSAWQRSGLIGLSKVVSLKTKFFKKTKLQILWDFLSSQHIPRGQAVVFRVGYTF